MSDKLTRLYIKATNNDRGQGALEYIGILAVVAIIVLVAVAAVRGAEGDMQTTIETAISDILSGG